jgi:hypothetical protein
MRYLDWLVGSMTPSLPLIDGRFHATDGPPAIELA